MTDRATVPIADVRAACELLGLDPERFHNTCLVVISPHRVTASRWRRTEDGNIAADRTGKPLADETSVAISYGACTCGTVDTSTVTDGGFNRRVELGLRDPACPVHGEVGRGEG